MDSRRRFVGRVAYGLAGTLAGPARVLGANERIRVGIVGAGERGIELAHQVRACGNAEIVAFADIYDRNLERACAIEGARACRDHRSMLDDANVDAVLIATPQHLHARQAMDALGAGKHVYLEKTAALTVTEAKQLRSAYRASTKVVQVGHQACSTGHARDVAEFVRNPGALGRITAIAMQMHRNTPAGKAQWARPALLTSELQAEAVQWEAFDDRGFDPHRLIHWRYFWDYSGGTVFEYMSQQLAFWYKALDLAIPESANMQGATYVWRDGREVPDTVNVTLRQPEELLVTWTSGLGNNQLGVGEEVLGTNGTISRATQVKYTPQRMNRNESAREQVGRSGHAPQAHVENFFAAIRGTADVACSFDVGFRVAIACRMAVESFLRERTVKWDARREEIV
jgi:predicted dehydrogenase